MWCLFQNGHRRYRIRHWPTYCQEDLRKRIQNVVARPFRFSSIASVPGSAHLALAGLSETKWEKQRCETIFLTIILFVFYSTFTNVIAVGRQPSYPCYTHGCQMSRACYVMLGSWTWKIMMMWHWFMLRPIEMFSRSSSCLDIPSTRNIFHYRATYRGDVTCQLKWCRPSGEMTKLLTESREVRGIVFIRAAGSTSRHRVD